MTSRQVRVGCEFVHVATGPTPTVYNVQVLTTPRVALLEESWAIAPDTPIESLTDMYANHGRRLILPAGESLSKYDALVEVPDELDEADPHAPQLAP